MALDPKLRFSGGELDPILHDNVTLERFKSSLATARNVMISKTGGILTRATRNHFAKCKDPDKRVKIYCPKNSGHLLEFGDLYVRVHASSDYVVVGAPYAELVTTYTEDDLDNLHFDVSKNYVYIFCKGKKTQKLKLAYGGTVFVNEVEVFAVPAPTIAVTVTPSGTPAGYSIDYLIAVVVNGEESLYYEKIAAGAKPVGGLQLQSLQIDITPIPYFSLVEVNEVRIYSRISIGAGYGFLGSTTRISIVGGVYRALFTDFGSLPDYTQGPQELISKYGLFGKSIIDLKPATGAVYQQRLLLGNLEDDAECILASRPAHQNNFYRDFPYGTDSSLKFKAGTSGQAEVLRILDHEGLIVFTSVGVYTNGGVLSPENNALVKRGGWIINTKIEPLVIPGGVFFVDNMNQIRQMQFSNEIQAYESVEQSIFSAHLFKKRSIKTWCYQGGDIPVIIVTFLDGSYATFTYQSEQQMRAWTRHDSRYPVEQVVGTDIPNVSFYVTNKDGQRYIERSLPRYIPISDYETDPEWYMSAPTAFMDAIATGKAFVDFAFIGDFELTPVTPDVWDGPLTLTGSGAFQAGWVGTQRFRWFHPVDRTRIDFDITAYTSTSEVTVQPSEEFPSEYAVNPRLYRLRNFVVGLAHLEGEQVSVVVDGDVVSSPNDVNGISYFTVTGGVLELPEEIEGGIIHVGRPIIADVKTLNMSTIEQSPTLIESLTVNKMYIKIFESLGMYVGNKFPDGVDGLSVVGMEDLEKRYVPEDEPLLGNKPTDPVTKRIELTMVGAWDTQGEICIRQVDPRHFEIMSIIPDVTVEKRSDR